MTLPTAAPMADDEALVTVQTLEGRLRTGAGPILKLDQYYRGRQALNFLHPEVQMAVGDRLHSLVINWPRLVLDSLEERLDVTGFRMPGADDADKDIWSIWQANRFDLESGQCHLDSLKHGVSYVTVWSGDADPAMPRLAVETARQMTVVYQPGTRVVAAALKMWQDPSAGVVYANLLLPDRVVKYRRGGAVTPAHRQQGYAWAVYAELENPLGVVPVVPFTNRYDTDCPDGESELADVIPLADAVNKLATDMMVSSEFHAMPRRWATGIEIPKAGPEHQRLQAEAKAYWERATAGKVWLAGEGVTFGQFAVAELTNFINGIRLLAQQAAALCGLPPHELGVIGDANPASADAIRSAEAKLVRRARRKQRTFDEAWEQVMCIALAVRDGVAPDEALELETIWADAETPTVAQKSDAAVKLKTADIIDTAQAQEDLGYSPAQRQRMLDRAAAAAAAQASPDVANRVRQAIALMDEHGLPAQAAFAAVGLLEPSTKLKPGPDVPAPPAGDAIGNPDGA